MMEINVESRHLSPDKKLTEFVYEKAEQLGKVYDRIESIDVVLKIESDSHNKDKIVEVNANVPQKRLFAREQAETFELATDQVMEDMKLQIIKHKEKLSSHTANDRITE
jgi:putative sigma-54 modulation protein